MSAGNKDGVPRKIVFATDLGKQSYKLLEVTDDILQELERNEGSVCIKGKPDEEAVLCTATNTYSMKLAVSSNTLLLLPPDDKPPSPHCAVVASLSNHYELTKMMPRLHPIKSLLMEHCYRGPEEELGRGGNTYGFSELLALVQASELELHSALQELNAVELDDCWRILAHEYVLSLLDLVLTTAVERDWDLLRLYAAECFESLPDHDPRVVRHVLQMYGSRLEALTPEQWKLDLSRVSIFRAIQLLQIGANGSHWRVSDFEQAWRDCVPDGAAVGLDMLRGLAITTLQGNENYIRYLPPSSLSIDPKDRFRELFAIRPKWVLQELEPYVKDLVGPGAPVEPFLLKHARLTQSAGGVRSYCSRE